MKSPKIRNIIQFSTTTIILVQTIVDNIIINDLKNDLAHLLIYPVCVYMCAFIFNEERKKLFFGGNKASNTTPK